MKREARMPETQFIETEALLRAMQDAEADSGNYDATLTYLREQFLPGELRKFEDAVDVLAECIGRVRREQRDARRLEADDAS
jgi:hypothetical protein